MCVSNKCKNTGAKKTCNNVVRITIYPLQASASLKYFQKHNNQQIIFVLARGNLALPRILFQNQEQNRRLLKVQKQIGRLLKAV